MRAKPLIAAAMALALTAPGVAQEATAGPASAPTEQTDMDRGGLIFSTFVAAVQDPEIPSEEKNALIGCLYRNTLETISKATGEKLAQNPQIDATDPVNVYLVAAIICGAREAAEPAEGTSAPGQ